MAGIVSSVMAFLTVHSVPHRILVLPELDRRTSKIILPCSKLCWLSSDGEIRYGRSFLLKKRLIGLIHRRRLSERTMMVLPKASFVFEYQARELIEYEQNLLSFLHNGAAAAVKLLPVWLSPESLSENTSEGFLNNISSFPIDVSMAAVAAAVGGAAGYLVAVMPISKKENKQKKDPGNAEPSARDWLLVMNSNPFNRFVLMRCPSIVFEEADVYEGLAKKLTTEGRHFVRLQNDSDNNSDCDSDRDGDGNGDVDGYGHDNDSKWAGCVLRIASRSSSSFAKQVGEEPELGDCVPIYQRTFLHTGDGGVLAIDWPSHLELSGEHGLDTTFLLVPGTAAGSGDKNVLNFVQRSLRCGYFPVVMNPRGCGGSPLITPRLFTAGDSDDIRAAVDFVLKARPWATIMAVGWGYGANMLAKYLGEEAAATPVIAAVCMENPLDLEESTKFSGDIHGTAFDREMTNGFVQILKSNQMVFEGRKKEFDVQKGLLARSVRDFDEAISRVSKGFDSVQDFYDDSSSRSWIKNVKIPIFCIQDNDSIGRMFSIPRHIFEENPFTTLILSLTKRWKPNGKLSFETTAGGHYDSLVIEWLGAVELAFLRGLRPVLQGIDVTFKPPKEWSLFGQLPSPQNQESLVSTKNPFTGIRDDSNYGGNLPYTKQRITDWDLWNTGKHMDQGPNQKDSNTLVDALKNIDSVEKDKVLGQIKGPINGSDSTMDKAPCEGSDGDGSDEDDSGVERGQVQQAAESVMKVLDVTMPGTLSKKQKEEVLEAVGRGETIVTALQEACPEDVREKMATAVAAAVQARGISLKLAGFGKTMPAPKIPDGMKEKIQEKLSSIVHNNLSSASTNGVAALSQSDSATESNNMTTVNHNQSSVQPQVPVQAVGAKDIGQEVSDIKQPESSASAAKPGAAALVSQDGTGSVMEPPLQADSVLPQGFTSQLQGQTHDKEMQQIKSSENNVTEHETGNGAPEPASDHNGTNQEGKSTRVEKQVSPLPHEEQKPDEQGQNQESLGAAEQTKEPQPEATQPEKKSEQSTAYISSSEDQNRKGLGPNLEEVLSSQIPAQNPPPPSIDMSQALEALTGVDDSTQMAVTNVFGVIENVIEQLEKEQGQKDVQSEPSSSQEDLQASSIEGSDSLEDSGNEPQTSLQDEHTGGNSEQLGASQTTTTDDTSKGGASVRNETGLVNSGEFIRTAISPKITGIVSDVLKRNLGEKSPERSIVRGMVQYLGRKRILKSDQDIYANMSSLNTGLEKDSTSNRRTGISDADVALEYFEDENIWKFIGSTLDTSVPSEIQGDVGVRRENRAMKPGKRAHWTEHLESLVGKPKPYPDMQTSSEITQVIEPAYIILDNEMKIPEIQSCVNNLFVCDDDETAEFASEGSISEEETCEQGGMGSTSSSLREKIRELVVDALEIEILRRLGDSGMETLGTALDQDIAKIGLAVAETAKLDMQSSQTRPVVERVHEGISKGTYSQGTSRREKLHAETIISAINDAYDDTVVLPSFIPAGVLFGIVLAALSPMDIIRTDYVQNDQGSMQIKREESDSENPLSHLQTSSERNLHSIDTKGSQVYSTEYPLLMQQQHGLKKNDSSKEADFWEEEEERGFLLEKLRLSGAVDACDRSTPGEEDVLGEQMTPANNQMMNVVAAAMSATAALTSQRPINENSFTHAEHVSPKVGSDFTTSDAAKFASEVDDDKAESSNRKANIVSSLAEKAISMAAPVVPTKEDGGVDHERLVEILAGLGQKGGILRYIAKVALLWGGLRGAMSLTDRLLVFLHMSDRPLHQRILGFLVIALLLWSPVLVPLLPTLLQQWASQSHNGVASTAALIGLYGAVVILVIIWGRKIRGHEDPLHQYGVKLQPPFSARQD